MKSVVKRTVSSFLVGVAKEDDTVSNYNTRGDDRLFCTYFKCLTRGALTSELSRLNHREYHNKAATLRDNVPYFEYTPISKYTTIRSCGTG